jgi:predicted DNA-binding transcriptional regulator AlpA
MQNTTSLQPTQTPNASNTVTMPRLWDQRELARYVGKSTAWCERARWAGEGPRFIKLGRHVRYRAEDVMSWIDECSRTSTSEGAI